ncbi:methyltransferase domain-containing protein [Candidatus Pacearchaeota archaeon]|nr:methyltransferase domain-containing protein [Candidatus Pacearchaeota archaeon]
MKLNIGCENEYKKGWVNLDVNKEVKADVYFDLSKLPDKKLPFKDSQFDEILCSHVLEHVDDVEGVMNEIYRIGGGRMQDLHSRPICLKSIRFIPIRPQTARI